jgi:spore coat protein U-like protein
MPMSRLLLLALLAAFLWLAPRPAQAVTCNARIDNFSFGSGVTSTGRDTTATLFWQCSRGSEPPSQPLNLRVCMFITAGTSAPGVNPRWLRRDTAPNILVKYDIFADPALTQVVGDEASNLPFGFTATLAANDYYQAGSVPIYGRIYPNQAMLAYQYTAANLALTPVRSSYNTSGAAPTTAQCLAGIGDGTGTSDSTDTITIQAQMSDSCSIGTAGDLSFGQVTTLGANQDQTSVITFQCRAAWQVGLGNGSNFDGTHRRMAAPGGKYINYELYRNSGRTQRWGTTLNNDTVSGAANYDTLTQVTVYGRVPAQAALPGNYSDTITVTLTF